MTSCGCDFNHEEEEKIEETAHTCCGSGHCHDDEEENATATEHVCCGGEHCQDEAEDVEIEEGGCGCGHDHGHSHELSQEDLTKLKSAITEAGYQFEETPEGEIRILEK